MEYKYCPVCKTEYEPHVKICIDCKAELATKDALSELRSLKGQASQRLQFASSNCNFEASPPPKKMILEMTTVYRASSELEALNLVGLLEKHNIRAKASSKQVPMYDDVFKTDMGYWGEVLVLAEDLDESKIIIEEYLQGALKEYVVIFVTASGSEEAEKIALELLNRKLAACVNISEKIKSMYWWQGKIETSNEALMIIKTTQEKMYDVTEAVKSLHSYTVPEIISIPIMEGNEDYLRWIGEAVKG